MNTNMKIPDQTIREHPAVVRITMCWASIEARLAGLDNNPAAAVWLARLESTMVRAANRFARDVAGTLP